MNILMICHKSPLGAYARSHVMGSQLVQRGHQVTLVMVAEKEHLHIETYDWQGVRAVVTPSIFPGRLHYGWDPWDTLNRILFLGKENQKYDLVQVFETRPSTIYPGLWYSRKHKLPLISDWNDWYGHGGLANMNRPRWYHFLKLEAIETFYEEAFRAPAAGLTVISTALQERALKLGVHPERIFHLPGGTFPAWFQARSQAECRQRCNFPLGVPVLGFSSSDSHFDLEIVMSALAIVRKVYPNIEMIVTGKAKPSVHELVRSYQLENHVRFVGYLPFEDLPWYLGCADLFLLPLADRPYNRGRWPNKMGEYMSLGRPTVANPVGDIKHLFEQHPVGLLASWEAEDFAEKIIQLLSNPEQAAELGTSARKVAESKYDWRILTERLEKFYQKILVFESRQGLANPLLEGDIYGPF